MTQEGPIEIARDELVAHLDHIRRRADDDLVRIVELLLVENAVLKRQISAGLLRGTRMQIESYPRFLELVDDGTDHARTDEGTASQPGQPSDDEADEPLPKIGPGQGSD